MLKTRSLSVVYYFFCSYYLFPPEVRIADCGVSHSTTMKSDVTKDRLLFQVRESS